MNLIYELIRQNLVSIRYRKFFKTVPETLHCAKPVNDPNIRKHRQIIKLLKTLALSFPRGYLCGKIKKQKEKKKRQWH